MVLDQKVTKVAKDRMLAAAVRADQLVKFPLGIQRFSGIAGIELNIELF